MDGWGSEPPRTIDEEDLAASFGRPWTAESKAACIGKRIDAAVPLILSALDRPVSADNVAHAEALLMNHMTEIVTEHLPLLPGVRELLDG